MHVGVLSAVFRVLGKPMSLKSKKSSADTLPYIYLYTFISKCKSSSNLYMPNVKLKAEKDGDIIEGSKYNEIKKN
jgi:hypothetical protein